MKQEQRLVAELYHLLSPFIDSDKDIFVSLDGQAALTGVQKGHFIDGTLPDLWFTLVGNKAPTLAEVKIIDDNGRLLLMRSQLVSWRTRGSGAHRPHFWVASNRAFNRFYIWSHEVFLPKLDASSATANTLTVLPPAHRIDVGQMNEVALWLLRMAGPSGDEIVSPVKAA
ncbi:hypothetical protein KB879_27265 [Cupriavidus sp. KK10]|jgi:hypothetical protein|uniref:hypothetical protein n=1 Tax=Cupriavidus sp. KK10 TaxID=1478019 RepID=UPI001BAAC9C8|nr:hypothetical protein [Cupriavidus sp. KK10]QUN27717.1 hypothetical protein KB879_27265 [Cupriavidus sp. KK10]